MKQYLGRRYSATGFTIIEIVLVVAIVGILSGLVAIRLQHLTRRAQEVRIRNDVRQMRLLAEQVYEFSGGSYQGWAGNTEVGASVVLLRDDIDKVYGDSLSDSWQSVVLGAREKEFCISAPLFVNGGNNYYCTDASGEFYLTEQQCQAPVLDDDGVACTGDVSSL